MMRVLLWKEYREHRSIWLAMAALSALILLALFALLDPPGAIPPHSDKGEIIAGVGGSLLIIYGFVCGSIMLAGEYESGSVRFLDALTGSRSRVWWAKTLAGTGLVLSQALCVCALIFGLGARMGSLPVMAGLGILIAVCLGTFAWGMLGSSLCRSVVMAAAMALLLFIFLGTFSGLAFAFLLDIACRWSVIRDDDFGVSSGVESGHGGCDCRFHARLNGTIQRKGHYALAAGHCGDWRAMRHRGFCRGTSRRIVPIPGRSATAGGPGLDREHNLLANGPGRRSIVDSWGLLLASRPRLRFGTAQLDRGVEGHGVNQAARTNGDFLDGMAFYWILRRSILRAGLAEERGSNCRFASHSRSGGCRLDSIFGGWRVARVAGLRSSDPIAGGNSAEHVALDGWPFVFISTRDDFGRWRYVGPRFPCG